MELIIPRSAWPLATDKKDLLCGNAMAHRNSTPDSHEGEIAKGSVHTFWQISPNDSN